ncbi:hypothetical protein Btru_016598 [Bulinus truncatus]|nr:hypothetical protein Btru_016598 [Bulinus truncatus]
MEREITPLFENFLTAINSTKCISLSQDNKAALCFSEHILIYQITCNANFHPLTCAFKTVIQRTPDASSLKEFSFAQEILLLKDSFSNLSETEKEQFITDASLCDSYIYPNDILKNFKRAKFSPIDFDSTVICPVIAALTFNHQLVFFKEEKGEWKLLTDCSPAIRNQAVSNLTLPLTIGKDLTLNEYVYLMHGMSTEEIEWSSIFKPPSRSSVLLLFTGARNGKVSLWKVGILNESPTEFNFVCSDSCTSSVTALKWLAQSSCKGLLSIGYSNGSVRLLEVSVDTDIHTKEIYSELRADNLAIFDLGWSKTDSNTTVLLACKQFFISVYALREGKVSLIHNYFIESELQLSSISVSGNSGIVASLSGDVVNFTCREEMGEIFLDITAVDLKSLQKDSKSQWLCMGIGAFEPSSFFISVHKLNYRSKFLEFNKRIKNNYKIVTFSPVKPSIKLLEDLITCLGSPQHTMIHLRLLVEYELNYDGDANDLLEICKYLDKCDSIKSLQILRDMVNFIQYWSGVNKKVNLEESLSVYKDVTEKLLIKYVESILNQNLTREIQEPDLPVLKSILTWLKADNSRCARLGFLARIIQFVLYYIYYLNIQLHLHLSEILMVKCTKGHCFSLCSLSFIPCQSFNVRKCEACGHPALSWQHLSGIQILKQKHLCSLCGGFLR